MISSGRNWRSAIVLAVCLVASVSATAGKPALERPTEILVLPPEKDLARDRILLGARVLSDAGVSSVRVRLWHEGQPRPAIREMTEGRGDRWKLSLPADAEQMFYFVEAYDARGNGPVTHGSVESPFAVRPAAMMATSIGTASRGGWELPLFVTLGVLAAGWAMPLSGPKRRQGGSRIGHLQPRHVAVVQRECTAGGAGPVSDRFWICLLHPLAGLREAAAEGRVQMLAGRPQIHPELGKRYFNLQIIRQRLIWARGLSPEARDELLTEPASERVAGSAGTTLIELMGVITLLGLVMAVGAMYLKAVERPVSTAGEQLEGLFKQTRAMAMATTTVHRVRPVAWDELVVESATSCSSGTWTLEPGLELRIPKDVRFLRTDWSICFNSRGIASDNLSVTLRHPLFDSKQLEVLRGGLVRWNE